MPTLEQMNAAIDRVVAEANGPTGPRSMRDSLRFSMVLASAFFAILDGDCPASPRRLMLIRDCAFELWSKGSCAHSGWSLHMERVPDGLLIHAARVN